MNPFSIAWKNTLHDKKRTFIILGGVSFSLLFIFLQVGFLEGGKRLSTLYYDYLDFDLIVVSKNYQIFAISGDFDRTRLAQAKATGIVKDVDSFKMSIGQWLDKETDTKHNVMIISLPENERFLGRYLLSKHLAELKNGNKIIADSFSSKALGDISIGRKVDINDVTTEIADTYKLGMFFLAPGSILVKYSLYNQLLRFRSQKVDYGLIKLKSGINLKEGKRQLIEALPNDVKVFTKAEIIGNDQDYFINEKPIGIIFKLGMVISFIVGAVVLFQALLTEVKRNLGQFATLKALGFENGFIYKIMISQAFIIAMISYAVTLVMSYFIYKFVYWYTHLPTFLTLYICFMVLVATFVMCIIPILGSLNKLRRSMNIADLF